MNPGEFTTGHTFSHYRLLEKLGEGGMGVVYLAEDITLCRQIAVKFMHADRNNLSRGRFLREARSASILNHPNIATVYDFGETDDGHPFIVMEVVHGKALSDLIDARSLTLERSLTIIESVLEALVEAHRHGIVHRDIKPSNIVTDDLGRVKVLDFGLAKSLWTENVTQNESADPRGVTTQTLSGVVLGTPLYVSPEQAIGTLVDQRSDLFSVGAVLYECITGRPAFAAPSVVEIFAQVIGNSPPPPSKFSPGVSAELDRITLRALARTVEDRYQSAEEFLQDLRLVRTSIHEGNTVQQRVGGKRLNSLRRKIISRANESSGPFWKPVGTVVSNPRQLALVVVTIVLALFLLFVGLRSWRQAPIDSIAVIPFANESHDESIEYLSEGFTDSLISGLSQLSGLKVISHNSVSRYKGQQVDPTVVGADLKVRSILTGRMSRMGDDLRVAVELIDSSDRSRLWGEQYNRKISDVPLLQADIAARITEKLRQRLSNGSTSTLTKRLPVNPASYDLYAKGRWFWNKRTSEGKRQAVACFQQAIDLDPTYALAYAGLADIYVLAVSSEPRDSYLRAKAAADRALELDGTLGEAHATLGFIKSHYERDWAGGEAEFRRAIELSPNYATAHHWYADELQAREQFDQALQELKRAEALDPLSPIINADIGTIYFYGRQYDRSIEHLRSACDLFPDFFPAHLYLGWAYTQKQMYAEALAEYQQAATLSKGHSLVLAAIGYNYAVSGKEAEARKTLKELEDRKSREYVSPIRFALVYAGLRQRDQAFEWLDKAYDELDIQLIYIKVNPFFDSLRDDPRFGLLVQRLGLASQ